MSRVGTEIAHENLAAIPTASASHKKCVTERCTNLLSRKDFHLYQSLEDQVQGEVKIRQLIRQTYNKQRHDFE